VVLVRDKVAPHTDVDPKNLERDGHVTIDRVIEKEERDNRIPQGLLKSISKVESGHSPYAVNAKNGSNIFRSKSEATAFISRTVRNGHHNISVGCMQLHYKSHRRNFRSVDDMLTPEKNIAYAARHLKRLHDKYGTWEKAVKMYHASSARHNGAYYRKVMGSYKPKTQRG
jgi:soluble lytic murein transglycosylase-like protein